MAKLAKELSAIEVKRLKEGTHLVGGVAGLSLQVTKTNSRSWLLRMMVGSKRKEIGLGSYPAVGVAEARKLAQATREAVGQGVDPVEEKKRARAALKAAQDKPTFQTVAEEFIRAKSGGWRNEKHAYQWTQSLTSFVYPKMGKKRVDAVTVQDVRSVLEPIWSTKRETAVRVRARIENVLDYSTALGYRPDTPNPARLKANLDRLLPKDEKKKRVRHLAALPFEQVGALMEKLRKVEGVGAGALEFIILTACRSGEARGATWNEIDLDAKVWTVAPERMKAGREHRVPLSDAAVAVLMKQPRTESAFIFPNTKGELLSDVTVAKTLHRLAPDVTVHGFRSCFRDWCSERTPFPREVCEMALAHTIRDSVEAAYRRGDLFQKRTALMTAWANYCASVEKSATVTPLRAVEA